MTCTKIALGPAFTVWFCTPDPEAWAEREAELHRLEHELEADKDNEVRLGRLHVLGELDCPWPWYAEDPWVVQDPEVFRV